MKEYLYLLANVLLLVGTIKGFIFNHSQLLENTKNFREAVVAGFRYFPQTLEIVAPWYAAGLVAAWVSSFF